MYNNYYNKNCCVEVELNTPEIEIDLEMGAKGPQGVQGPQGPQGIEGPTGPIGNGISSIEKTSTSGLVDTYTITYTNGNTTTFDVSNGEVTREELEEEVERLSMIYNAFPTTTGEGEEPSINGTAEVPFKEIGLKGNTSQNTTTGKNLFNISKVITNWNTSTNMGVKNNNDGTLTISTPSTSSSVWALEPNKLSDYCPSLQVGDKVYITATTTGTQKYVYLTTSASVWTFGTLRTISQNDLDSAVLWYSSGTSATAIISNIMISTSGGEYEPYTGGIASPNPDYPQDVHVVSGDNEVKVENENLFNGSLFVNETVTGITLSHNDKGEIVLNGTSTARANFNAYFFDIPESWTQLVLSGGTTNVSFSILTFTSGGTYISQKRDSGSGATYTIPSNATKYALNIRIDSGVTLSNYVLKAQLKKDTSTTEYTSHQEQTYPINLGSIELCKIGDYQDYIYKENGKWYLNKEIGKVVLDGSENWIYNDVNQVFVLPDYVDYIRTGFIPYSNYYKGTNISTYSQLNNNEISFLESTSQNRMLIKNTNYTIISDFKAWLSTHNAELYYVLATPTITEITDTTLIEQLDNLEKAYSYDTQTNISQTNQDKPFIISYEAILSLRNILNNLETRIAVL